MGEIDNEYINKVYDSVRHLGDWFRIEKCNQIANFINKNKPKTCVEIGVFRGHSAIATAELLKRVESGVLYAVDPWSTEATQEGTNDSANDEWWASLDMNAIKAEFVNEINIRGLDHFVKAVQMKGEDFAKIFDKKVDLLHIDGNHSEEKSCLDVELWMPKLNENGMIIMDDINWRTTKRAQELIEESAQKIYQTDTFAVYIK